MHHKKCCNYRGSGSIGIDLMYKAIRSPHLDLCVVVGRNKDSSGLAMAKEAGLETSHEGISYLARHINEVDIVLDATSAKANYQNLQAVRDGVNDMIQRVRAYVPGYELVLEPVETKIGVLIFDRGGRKAFTPLTMLESVNYTGAQPDDATLNLTLLVGEAPEKVLVPRKALIDQVESFLRSTRQLFSRLTEGGLSTPDLDQGFATTRRPRRRIQNLASMAKAGGFEQRDR